MTRRGVLTGPRPHPWLVIVGLVAIALAGALDATPAGAAPGQPTALAVTIPGAAQPVRGSDGRQHIEYDLLITNALDVPMTLRAIDVVDGRGRRLLRLEGPALAQHTHALQALAPTTTVPASASVATMIDVAVRSRRLPTRVTQRIAYGPAAGAAPTNMVGSWRVHGPSVAVSRRAPVAIAPPLAGGPWLAFNACCQPSGHRATLWPVNGRLVKAETFAVDLLRVRDGLLYRGDGSEPTQWFGAGTPLLAVADGVVVRAVDGRPESRPAPFGTPEVGGPDEFAGNSVVLRIRRGVYASYAHIRPGTLQVRVGQRVRRGQALGRLGNSGQTSAPHLHFSMQAGPDPSTSRSLPFAIDRFRSVGAGQLVTVGDDGAIDPRVQITAHPPRAHLRAYPLTDVLVDFATR